jgi:hypothetical protein
VSDWYPQLGETCWYKDRPAYAPASDIPVIVVAEGLATNYDWIIRRPGDTREFHVYTSQLRPMSPLEALGSAGE